MNQELLRDIIRTYEKYEWELKAIIFTESNSSEIQKQLRSSFNDIELRMGEINSAWFTRPSKHDRQAWELRLISEKQVALFETFPNDLDEKERINICNEMETRLLKLSSKKM